MKLFAPCVCISLYALFVLPSKAWDQPAMMLGYGKGSEVKIDHPLDKRELLKLSCETKILDVGAGAERNLLDDRHKFPHLSLVALSDQVNDHFLETLSDTHPNIAALCIEQSVPLSKEAMSYLSRFRNLKDLELHCQVSDPEQLTQYLPGNLAFLSISQSCNLGELKHLVELTLIDCPLDAKLLENLDAPRLQTLSLYSTNVDDKTLQSLSSYPSLKDLEFIGVRVSNSERRRWNRFTTASIHAAGEPSTIPLDPPLRPLLPENAP